ncbi:MAG TPA: ParB N-terminal domain-containing protein [Anaeromyxobacter sp.]|nr:ParB N-terminal domain-containing protein [Anaeromyxobacter sp.]
MELEPRTSAPAHATGAVEFVPLEAIAEDATFRLREEGDVSVLAASLGRLGQLVPLEVRPLPGVVGPARFQVVAGFRRVAALRLLRRERALARVHSQLSDDDAWGLALSLALLTEPLDRLDLESLRERLAAIAPWATDAVDEALVHAPVDAALRDRFRAFIEAKKCGEPPAPADEVGLEERPLADDERELSALDGHSGPLAGDAAGEGGSPGEAEGEEPVEMTPEELAVDLAARLYEVNQDLAVAYESWEDLPADGRSAIIEQARWIADLLPRLEAEDKG